MKSMIVVFAVCLWCINAFTQEADADKGPPVAVIIKENRIFTFASIEKVEQWGIVVSDNGSQQTILYKVIEKIELADSSFAYKIQFYIPTVLVTRSNGFFILDFQEAEIPILEYRQPHIIDFDYVPLALRLDPVETFEAGLVYSLWPIHLFKHHLSFSTALPYAKNPSYHVMAFNYGIGTPIYRARNIEFLYRVYFHFKVMERTHGFASTFKEMCTLSIEPQVLFVPARRAFPSISLRYYFDNFEIENRETRLILIAALNIAIGKKD